MKSEYEDTLFWGTLFNQGFATEMPLKYGPRFALPRLSRRDHSGGESSGSCN